MRGSSKEEKVKKVVPRADTGFNRLLKTQVIMDERLIQTFVLEVKSVPVLK